ncbi:MAG: hypothetical protein AB7O65_06835 [Candidatus Korobacteraceae bacterium]
MRDPFFCPVCNGFDVRRLVESGLNLNAEDGEGENLLGYICHEGHVFFVRSCDLEAWEAEPQFP